MSRWTEEEEEEEDDYDSSLAKPRFVPHFVVLNTRLVIEGGAGTRQYFSWDNHG